MYAENLECESDARAPRSVPFTAALRAALDRRAAFLQAMRARLVLMLGTLILCVVGAAPQMLAHASTSITIDTDVLFGSVNTWITTFLPIFAIGLGIAIAIAIISIVGDSILQGLRKGLH